MELGKANNVVESTVSIHGTAEETLPIGAIPLLVSQPYLPTVDLPVMSSFRGLTCIIC